VSSALHANGITQTEERVREEDRVERDREHADVHNHGLAPELRRVHTLEQPAAARALVDEGDEAAADLGDLPEQAHETEQDQHEQEVRGCELELHAVVARILKSLVLATF
jgi:hypothetical protein